jgi:hypothetical protein
MAPLATFFREVLVLCRRRFGSQFIDEFLEFVAEPVTSHFPVLLYTGK